MATLTPMNRARKTCSSQGGALWRFVTRKSTSKLRNQAHAPQSAAAARILCLLTAIFIGLLSQNSSRSKRRRSRWRQRFLPFSVSTNNLTLIRLWKGCGFRRFLFKKGKLAERASGAAPVREKRRDKSLGQIAPFQRPREGRPFRGSRGQHQRF